MKCVKIGTDSSAIVKRVTEQEAERLVAKGWSYVCKAAWKAFKAVK